MTPFDKRSVSVSIGMHLDAWGNILQMRPRKPGESDDDYRLHIQRGTPRSEGVKPVLNLPYTPSTKTDIRRAFRAERERLGRSPVAPVRRSSHRYCQCNLCRGVSS